jgi:hypothetical protein
MKTEFESELEQLQGSNYVLDRSNSLSVLRATANRLADVRKKPRLKTRDLVGLLLSHSARAWRASMPSVTVKLAVKNANGIAAIRLSMRT